jgi:hypothetical protein
VDGCRRAWAAVDEPSALFCRGGWWWWARTGMDGRGRVQKGVSGCRRARRTLLQRRRVAGLHMITHRSTGRCMWRQRLDLEYTYIQTNKTKKVRSPTTLYSVYPSSMFIPYLCKIVARCLMEHIRGLSLPSVYCLSIFSKRFSKICSVTLYSS